MSNVAVIGLRHGERHVHGFLAAGAKKVYAVDLNKDLYANVTHDYVVTSDDYKAVLPFVDMVVISLPPALHREVLQEVIKTGVSRIWIEKPLLDIGEDPHDLIADPRVEVIHELRRNNVVRDWVESGEKCQEVWMDWRRPMPSQYNPARYPVGVVHDLGSHLVDLSFALLGQERTPVVEEAKLLTPLSTTAQKVGFTLRFEDNLAHISVGWVEDQDWPEKEITVDMQTSSGVLSWASRKTTHRHLTEGGLAPNDGQIQEEKNWYAVALQGGCTHFASLSTAIMVQTICNDIVEQLRGNEL